MIADIFLQELREYLQYDAETGRFTRLKFGGGRKVGDSAGHLNKVGYVLIKFKGKQYKAHRLAWLLTHGKWPNNHIDHIDGNPSNNRLSNLRDVTHQENNHNLQKLSSKNKSGYRGVSWHTRDKKWRAQITLNSKIKHIGSYNTSEEASTAYEQAKLQYHPTVPVRIAS